MFLGGTRFGRAVGRRDASKASDTLWLTGVWSVFFGVLFSLGFLLFGHNLIKLLTDIPEVRQTAFTYLPWVWLLPLVAMWCFWLDGVFIGANAVVTEHDQLESFGIYAGSPLKLVKTRS